MESLSPVVRLMATIFALTISAEVCLGSESQTDSQGQVEEMMMVLGEQQVLDVSHIASFSESTRGIIEVKVPRSGRKMIITALRPGTTSLLLLHRNGRERT